MTPIEETKILIESIGPLTGVHKYPQVGDVYFNKFWGIAHILEIRENGNVRGDIYSPFTGKIDYMDLGMGDSRSVKRMKCKTLFIGTHPIGKLFSVPVKL